jgi:hypothetical protein
VFTTELGSLIKLLIFLGHCFHSYSQLWLWPYGYDYNAYPENYKEIEQLAIDASDALFQVRVDLSLSLYQVRFAFSRVRVAPSQVRVALSQVRVAL